MLRSAVAAIGLAVVAACSQGNAGDALPVHVVQGNGSASPYENRDVTVRGVVSGDFQGYDDDSTRQLGGFYVSSIEADDDPASSEGLFVFERGQRLGDVETGDLVEVDGRVVEHFGETQLVATAIRVLGTAEVAATTVSFPIEDFERYEGMLLEIPETLVIAGNRNLGRFGSLTLAAGERPYQYTNRELPDRQAFMRSLDDFRASSIVLDDGLRRENPDTIRYLAGDVPPRAGNGVTGLTGNLRWSRGSGKDGDEAWRLMPTQAPVIGALNPRTLPPAPGDALRVASFNVLNLFSTLDRGEPSCGPARDSGCRGADTRRELDRQLGKTVTALVNLDADIVGLAELENNARASLELLVGALAEEGLTYRYVDAGTIGEGTIKVGLLFRPDVVDAVGEPALLTRAVDGRFDDRRSRPALAQTFRHIESGKELTVVANHLKSKGSDCDDVNDPNRLDGQGNCNRTRTLAAAALADWANDRPAADSTGRVLVIGDMNAYLREDPIRTLETAGLVNLLTRDGRTDAYSYVYAGRAGALDHALATPALAEDVLRSFVWHANADEPPVLDYNLEFGRDPALFDANAPWRSSDHDPVIIDIRLGENGAAVR